MSQNKKTKTSASRRKLPRTEKRGEKLAKKSLEDKVLRLSRENLPIVKKVTDQNIRKSEPVIIDLCNDENSELKSPTDTESNSIASANQLFFRFACKLTTKYQKAQPAVIKQVINNQQKQRIPFVIVLTIHCDTINPSVQPLHSFISKTTHNDPTLSDTLFRFLEPDTQLVNFMNEKSYEKCCKYCNFVIINPHTHQIAKLCIEN